MRALSPSRLAAIALGALLASAVAFAVGRDAAGNAFASGNPDLAMRAVADHPVALAKTLDARVTRAGSEAVLRDLPAERITAALRVAPLSADLIRLLALAKMGGGGEAAGDGARTLIALAERTSRRDLSTQLWMIEDAAARNDVDAALRHYDIALTTSKTAPALLFPVLTQALAEPRIRAGLAGYVRRDRPWTDAFVAEATAKGTPRDVAALLAAAAPARRDPAFRNARAALVGAYVNARDYDGLRRYAASLPSADNAALRAPGFTPRTTAAGLRPLTWELTDNAELAASIDDGGLLRIVARGDATGMVARRIIFPAAGRWRLRHTVEVGTDTPAADLRWEWACLNANRADRIGMRPIPRRTGVSQVDIDIPGGCGAVELRIDAAGGLADIPDTNLTLGDVALTQLGVAPTRVGELSPPFDKQADQQE